MTDPIDTARPVNLADVIKAIRGKVIAVGDGRDFSYGLDTLDHALPAPAGWTWNQIEAAASQADTARQEGVSLGLEMAKAEAEAEGWLPGQRYAASERDEGSMDCAERIAQAILALAPIPPHVAAARVLLDAPDTLAAAMVDWADAHDFRLSQVQGFGYGEDRLLFTARDCWLRDGQVFWQKQSAPETKNADHDEMMRQMEIYRVSLALRAALEQIAKEGE